eukprot:3561780-Karenia_brevis.AAC.1
MPRRAPVDESSKSPKATSLLSAMASDLELMVRPIATKNLQSLVRFITPIASPREIKITRSMVG